MQCIYNLLCVLLMMIIAPSPQMIDDNHPCYLLKYLRNKPVRELKGEEFLKLCQAENDRLLEIKITIDLDMGSDKRCVWV